MGRRRFWLKTAIASLAGLFAVLALPGVARADVWSDFRDAQWLAVYGVTAAEVDGVADGYIDGTFRPFTMVTRGQFAKMAVLGLDLETVTPSAPSFTDVPKSQTFYSYIEGAAAVDLVQGLGGGLFGPARQISRQQAATILARYLSSAELKKLGYIVGQSGAHYSSLTTWYSAEGESYLSGYADQASIATVHRAGVAYLIARGVTEGSGGKLTPTASITRAQSAVMILRVVDKVADLADTTTTTVQAPTITAISPTTGSAAGGTTVVITGTNFTSGATVMFGSTSVASSNVSVDSSTQITVVTPAGTAGSTVRVRVITSAGTTPDTSADDFTYQGGVPTITAVSPAAGYPAGGDTVTITGTNFTSDAAVYFGTTAVSSSNVTVNSTTQITVVTPAGTSGTTVRVAVTTSAGTSADTLADDFSYGLPTVTGLSPKAGAAAGGYSVTITGTGFSGKVTVKFGSITVASGNVTVTGPTQITATAPAGTDGTTVDVTVTNDYGTSANTSADDFTYESTVPTITDLSSHTGDPDGGETLVITGTGFTSNATVAFSGTTLDSEYVTVNSSTQITVMTPPGTDGTVAAITVTTSAGTSSGYAFTYQEEDLPVITSLSPNNGTAAGGNAVIIMGSNFTPDSVVAVAGVTVSSAAVTIVSTSEIVFVMPAGTAGSDVLVTVTTHVGTSNSLVYSYAVDSSTETAGSGLTSTITYSGMYGAVYGRIPLT